MRIPSRFALVLGTAAMIGGGAACGAAGDTNDLHGTGGTGANNGSGGSAGSSAGGGGGHGGSIGGAGGVAGTGTGGTAGTGAGAAAGSGGTGGSDGGAGGAGGTGGSDGGAGGTAGGGGSQFWCEPEICPDSGTGEPCCASGDGPCGYDYGDGDCRDEGGGIDASLGRYCEEDDDCPGNRCIEGEDGTKVCTVPCEHDCPNDDWICAVDLEQGRDGWHCVPRFKNQCRPCETDAECRIPGISMTAPPACITVRDEGMFCSATCDEDTPCPNGFHCNKAEVDGQWLEHCIPNDYYCPCKPHWAGKGYSTTCDPGLSPCPGSRNCDSGTLSACTPEPQTQEICDGKDNDCDSVIDNGSLCGDGADCTTDSCEGRDGCQNELQSGSCHIDQACFADGTINPLNPCERCLSTQSTNAWTIQQNSCSIDGGCYLIGDPKPDSDCQICDPDETAVAWSVRPGSCHIDGGCYEPGDPLPGTSCEICNPTRSAFAPSLTPGEPCDDSNACTGPDICEAAGVCSGVLINDEHEPNETPDAAWFLGTMDECAANSRGVSGILASPGDVDWARARGRDTVSLCAIDPALKTDSGGAELRSCLFIRCDRGTTTHNNDVTCRGESENAIEASLPGHAGCCATGIDPSVSAGLDCDGVNDSADIRVRVDSLDSPAACVGYRVTLEF